MAALLGAPIWSLATLTKHGWWTHSRGRSSKSGPGAALRTPRPRRPVSLRETRIALRMPAGGRRSGKLPRRALQIAAAARARDELAALDDDLAARDHDVGDAL